MMMKKKSGWNKKYGKNPAKADKKKIGTIADFEENENFTKIYAELRELCDFIGKGRPDGITPKKYAEITQDLKNYILIRTINVMELQLQTQTVFLIDKFELEPSDILQKNEIKISLHDLDIFRQEDTTDGKIVTQEFKFANIRSINTIFSNINNLKFFSFLEYLFHQPIEKDLEYVLKLRNDVVHNLLDVEWELKKLKQYVEKVQIYSHMFFAISWINLATQLQDPKNMESVCKEKTDKTVAEFRETAKKYEF